MVRSLAFSTPVLQTVLHPVALLLLRAAFSVGQQVCDLAIGEAVGAEVILKPSQQAAIRIDMCPCATPHGR
jgi:hypothetical protein